MIIGKGLPERFYHHLADTQSINDEHVHHLADTQSINDEHVTGPSVPTRERTNGTQDRGGDLTVNQG